jgi:hypothetical protein
VKAQRGSHFLEGLRLAVGHHHVHKGGGDVVDGDDGSVLHIDAEFSKELNHDEHQVLRLPGDQGAQERDLQRK